MEPPPPEPPAPSGFSLFSPSTWSAPTVPKLYDPERKWFWQSGGRRHRTYRKKSKSKRRRGQRKTSRR